MKAQDAIFLPAGQGRNANVIGMTHITKVSPVEDGAAFLAAEIIIPPRCGPPMHRHAADSECFYVLEGQITFGTPDGEIVAKPGEFCFLPAGGAHSFRNDGDQNAKAFVVVSPGVAAHYFFGELDRSLNGKVDVAAVAEIGARNGLSFVTA
ncbi:MAG: cupin domain-containing protein [Caulobacterales bacterium]